MDMKGRNPRFNSSGSPDPTAYEALKPIIQEESIIEKKVRKLIHTINTVSELVGFEISGSITIKDKKSNIKIKRHI